jgi:transposase
MRRVHLRGHANILKRLLIHCGAFNLGLLTRQLIGVGTPRGLQGRVIAILGALLTLIRSCWKPLARHRPMLTLLIRERRAIAQGTLIQVGALKTGFTTRC